ncbi:MAG: hypothetical protein PF692_00320 [Kiritimatiellae bacterium]|jgi:uncharacterized membrane protein|nr:hypothetical protein [Kiritimatiellia bacterium]
MKRLTTEEEINFIKEITGDPEKNNIISSIKDSFNILQVRSQLLLGLITICLTITGFSGHRLAASGVPARIALFTGVISVLISALLLFFGPLKIRWITTYKTDSFDETVFKMLKRRDNKTKLYHIATGFLIVGLSSYIISLAVFLARYSILNP